ncbi:MAG: RluA family pseudouridine synthase [Candidatus Paceibacterota bacterium]|jgi:23S rRNA pseudouridine1911/1915/1917 synthase
MSNKQTSNLPDITILYEDADCVVVNKPAGLLVHSDGKAVGPFLTDWIAKHYPQTKDVGEKMNGRDGKPVDRGGIVHRLDRETSGALLIAKTAVGYEDLKKQFQDRTITKKYLAFVWGSMEEEFGTIDRPIGRSSGDFRKWSAERGTRGETREAETYWTLIANSKAPNPEGILEKVALLEVEPKTGRTHQIRVHLKAVNHPIIGDMLYAPNRPMVLGFHRTALHSASIEFETIEKKRLKIEAPLPADFSEARRFLNI